MLDRVQLVARTTAIAVLASCGGSTAPPTPVATSVRVAPSTLSFDAIGASTQLSATVLDQNGAPMNSATPTWRSAATSVATVSGAGLVTAAGNGSTTITAAYGHVSAPASVSVAQVSTAVAKVSGDQQSGFTGQALPSNVVVQVRDRLGHGVSGASVHFVPAAGSGSVSPTSGTTGANGQAQTTWTLGAVAGPDSLTATVAQVDSATFTASASVQGNAPSITSIAPDTLVEGESATITGSNFSTTVASDIVTIDGVRATVSAATSTSLAVVVPTYGCQPVRLVAVGVQVGSQSASGAPKPLRPASMTALAVGQEVIIKDPAKFCIQLGAAAGGNDVYAMGLSAPAELPGAVLPFLIATTSGSSIGATLASRARVAAPPRVPFSRSMAGNAALSARNGELRRAVDVWGDRARAEGKLRSWEAAHLPSLVSDARQRGLLGHRVRAAGVPVPSVGDTLTIRVPDFNAPNLCTGYTTVRAVVRVLGTAGIWVEDVTNPTTDSLTLADIQSASNQFDSKIYATDTTYFGSPSDIDGNGRVIVVLSWAVNKAPRILGFVFGGDLLPAGDASCPESNGGELYYGQVPDPQNVAGTGARAKADVVAEMPQLIAHEVTHVIQLSRRLVINDGMPMASWEMEGQATLAEELVGDAVLGNTSGQNYGASTAFGAAGFNWYEDVIIKWDEYFGLLGASNQAANAPDLCTVYGSIQLNTLPCDVSAFYGASWSLQRYIGDQYGPGYPGGLAQLTRDWVSKNVTASGTANIAALLGVDYDDLFVRFSTALALDDQSNSTGTGWVPAAFSITSWNSADLSSYLSSCCRFGWLTPPSMSFATASASRSVRGGSTAYTVFSALGPHPAMAVQLTDPASQPLGTGLRPALWLVRIQ